MVDKIMGQDLESFGIPILVLGDPAQLPPVKGGGYFTDQEPDVMLEEIHRQAADSRVLRIATRVRQGKGLGDEDHIAKGVLKIEDLAEFDQVLVGTNKSRRAINIKMREHLGRQGNYPEISDRLICTRNDGETGLLNGSQWIVKDVFYDNDTDFLAMTIQSVDEEGTFLNIDAHPHPFRGEEIPYWSMRDAQCFEYAYAMTVHKSQGSQFDTVCVVDESRCFPAHQRRAWLYTGITRAAKEVTIIR
jgi:exodeoxyribonuclease-5